MNESYHAMYEVPSGDFTNAGKVSRTIKNTLKRLGIDQTVIRRISVASYEAEMNQIIHSTGGTIELTVMEDRVLLVAQDKGPGIENVELAMQKGYSTASDEVRELGFGAGMGLPNMKGNADGFSIYSRTTRGTTITMSFQI
jgi:anti-sigma regulatory factor (Ser/Thr protein kinase)